MCRCTVSNLHFVSSCNFSSANHLLCYWWWLIKTSWEPVPRDMLLALINATVFPLVYFSLYFYIPRERGKKKLIPFRLLVCMCKHMLHYYQEERFDVRPAPCYIFIHVWASISCCCVLLPVIGQSYTQHMASLQVSKFSCIHQWIAFFLLSCCNVSLASSSSSPPPPRHLLLASPPCDSSSSSFPFISLSHSLIRLCVLNRLSDKTTRQWKMKRITHDWSLDDIEARQSMYPWSGENVSHNQMRHTHTHTTSWHTLWYTDDATLPPKFIRFLIHSHGQIYVQPTFTSNVLSLTVFLSFIGSSATCVSFCQLNLWHCEWYITRVNFSVAFSRLSSASSRLFIMHH